MPNTQQSQSQQVLRLLRDVIIVAGLFFMVFLLLWKYVPNLGNGYLSENTEKHIILANAESPKMVFIGGSNLTFGLDSALIEQQTGYTVVNMGLNAGIGLPVMMSEVTAQLQTGDVVVIIPEYEPLLTTYFLNSTLGRVYHDNQRLLENSLAQGDAVAIYAIVRSVPYALAKMSRLYIESLIRPSVLKHVRNKEPFNEYGDYTGHLQLKKNMSNKDIGELAQAFNALPDHRIPYLQKYLLRSFANKQTKQGVDVVLMHPCLIDSYAADTSEKLRDIATQLEEANLPIPILNNVNDCVLPADQFYDTKYHLTASGRAYRSEYTANLLNDFLTNQ